MFEMCGSILFWMEIVMFQKLYFTNETLLLESGQY
jgi:hypothetical protein